MLAQVRQPHSFGALLSSGDTIVGSLTGAPLGPLPGAPPDGIRGPPRSRV